MKAEISSMSQSIQVRCASRFQLGRSTGLAWQSAQSVKHQEQDRLATGNLQGTNVAEFHITSQE